MSVGAVGSSASIYSAQQPQTNYFQTLQQDLSSGNLSGAESAYDSIQQQIQSQGASSTSSTSSTSGTNSVASDFSALGQALQSGNLTAAQQAFQSLQTAGQGHHHHHHGGGGSSSSSQSQTGAVSLNGASLNITA